MNPQYIKIALMPPEDPPTKRELERQEFEQAAIDWVKKHVTIEALFDLYEHDREVAIRFHKWMMDYNSVHLVDILADIPQPTYEELWDKFCSPDNNLPLHEGEEFNL